MNKIELVHRYMKLLKEDSAEAKIEASKVRGEIESFVAQDVKDYFGNKKLFSSPIELNGLRVGATYTPDNHKWFFSISDNLYSVPPAQAIEMHRISIGEDERRLIVNVYVELKSVDFLDATKFAYSISTALLGICGDSSAYSLEVTKARREQCQK